MENCYSVYSDETSSGLSSWGKGFGVKIFSHIWITPLSSESVSGMQIQAELNLLFENTVTGENAGQPGILQKYQ